jgi:hypothetical protein
VPTPPLLIGTRISGRPAEARRRESAAQAALAGLAATGDAVCVNMAFADEAAVPGAIPSLSVLRLDAPRLSGTAGTRKPIVSEMLDALAAEAERRAIPRIAVVNGDIVVTAAALSRSAEAGRPAIAIGRTDVGGGEPDAQLLYGVDMFVFDVSFWRRARKRFRAYPLGEPVWDNVYTAVALAHGGVLLNRQRLIVHERHAAAWTQSPFAPYVHLLAARDGSYFSLWCRYAALAAALRAKGGTEDEELALQRETFRPPGAVAEAADIARAAWWRAKRALRR